MVVVAKDKNIVDCMIQCESNLLKILNQKMFKLSLVSYLYDYQEIGDILRNSELEDVSDIKVVNEQLKQYNAFLWYWIPKLHYSKDIRSDEYYVVVHDDDIKLNLTLDDELT